MGLNKAKFRGPISVHIQSLLTATSYNLKKLVKYSKGFKEKLKIAANLPVLPISEANTVRLSQRLKDNEFVLAVSGFKNVLYSFVKHILGIRLAYNMT
jgi:hypothetical protein